MLRGKNLEVAVVGLSAAEALRRSGYDPLNRISSNLVFYASTNTHEGHIGDRQRTSAIPDDHGACQDVGLAAKG